MSSITFATSLSVSLTLTLAEIISCLHFDVLFEWIHLVPILLSWFVTAVCFVFDGFIRVIEIEANV